MTHPRHPPPLRVELGPSWRLAVALATMHAGAIAVSGVVLEHTEWALAASTALVLHGLYGIRRYCLLRDGRSIAALCFLRGGGCTAYRLDGRVRHCRVGAATYVTPFLVVVILDPIDGGFSFSVAVLADAVTRETHRRLRVRLRWGGVEEDCDVAAGASL